MRCISTTSLPRPTSLTPEVAPCGADVLAAHSLAAGTGGEHAREPQHLCEAPQAAGAGGDLMQGAAAGGNIDPPGVDEGVDVVAGGACEAHALADARVQAIEV